MDIWRSAGHKQKLQNETFACVYISAGQRFKFLIAINCMIMRKIE